MRRSVLLLASMACAVLLASGLALAQAVPQAGGSPPAGSSEGEVIPGEYIVVLEDRQPAGFSAWASDVAQRMAQRHDGLRVERTYQHAFRGFAAEIPQGEVADVRNDPEILFVAPNREFALAPNRVTAPPCDPHEEQCLTRAVDRIEADESSARSGDGSGSIDADVAILDSGIDRGHEDLNVVGGKDCGGTSSGPFSDEVGHGTFVAGLAAAEDNEIGTVGVAPGARLHAVKVADDRGRIPLAAVLCGVDWVTARSEQIEVANMSFGGTVRNADDGACGRRNADPFHYAICRSVEEGVTYVASAGNVDRNIKNDSPPAYDEVLSVTAMADSDGEPGGRGPRIRCYPKRFPAERDDTAAFFSNFATPGSADSRHTISGPGVCVGSTVPDDDYARSSGTSFSAPLVAGTAALYKATHPLATPEQVMRALRAEAKEQPRSYGFRGDPLRPFRDRYYGYLVHAGDF